LEALSGLAAPSIEAPSLRALGRYQEALDAYRRWLAEVPGDATARSGEAWCLYYLGRDAEARAAFEALGSEGLYGLGLLANRAGARALRPRGSFVALVLGDPPSVPDPATADVLAAVQEGGEMALAAAPSAAAEALDLAFALAAVNDREAAVGELLFALRSAEAAGDAAAVLDIAEALQSLDEYRQSSRAGRELLAAGVQDIRAWRLAYPPAWPETVLAAARQAGVEPALVWAVMRQES